MPINRDRVKALKEEAAAVPPKPEPPPKKTKGPPQAQKPKSPPLQKKKKKPKPPKPIPEPPARVRVTPRMLKAGAVCVLEPPWGSPFRVLEPASPHTKDDPCTVVWRGQGPPPEEWADIRCKNRRDAQQTIVELFKVWLLEPGQAELLARARTELRGRLLACNCNPIPGKGGPCHGDCWLELCNS